MKKDYECALVLGKFMDAHVGHEALFHYALSKAEHLIILVCGQSTDRNPIEERVRWIEDTFGNSATVNAIDIEKEGLSGKEESDRGVSADWADWVTDQYKCVDLLVGSEDYVRYMGEHAELDYEIFDQERKQFPISSTKVNEGQHWRRIDAAKHAKSKRVVLVGPESCGKTTAAVNLNHLLKLEGNKPVLEHARAHLNPLGGFSLKDLEMFALVQEVAIRKAISNSFHPIQIIDSSAVTTKAYQVYRFRKQPYGMVDAILEQEETEKAFYLLYTPETEWVDDGTREMPNIEDRWRLFNLMAYVMESQGMKYTVITGKCHKDRLNQAIERITEECL